MKNLIILLLSIFSISPLFAQSGLEDVDPEVLIQKAQGHMEMGDVETAERYLNVVQQVHPNSDYAKQAQEVLSRSDEYAILAEERKMRNEAAKAQKQTRPYHPSKPASTVKEYCLILGSKAVGSKTITVGMDYGQSEAWMNRNKKMINDKETNKPMKFSSMVQALNHHAQFGWQLEETEMIDGGKVSHVRWLLVR